MIEIVNKDCMSFMNEMGVGQVDLVLTSPPYNTSRTNLSDRAINNHEGRYDIHIDMMTQDEYISWCVDLFNKFDKILKKNGVVLWNVSYGSDATVNKEGIGLVWITIADIIRNTPFTVADRIVWKKNSALPINTSHNKLTRIVEDVFVFCRKDEYKTYYANKGVKSISHTGQKFYENIFNFIEAPNNDGSNKLNKATFSSELVIKLLNIYGKQDSDFVVYDPFGGTGTTAVGAKKFGCSCICSELSEAQCKYANGRLK